MTLHLVRRAKCKSKMEKVTHVEFCPSLDIVFICPQSLNFAAIPDARTSKYSAPPVFSRDVLPDFV